MLEPSSSASQRFKVPCMHIPPFSLSEQLSELGPELEAAVLGVLQSGQYIGGQEVRRFEENFAATIGVPYVVGCNSGTDALVLALRALDVGPGDEVITASFSFFATAESISTVGATPVFVDVDPETYLLDLSKVESAVTSSTKAIVPVHLFGRPLDMGQLMSLAKKHHLRVIEDCAQATGASWDGLPVGSWGDIGCFSFFPTKNLGAAGDAGAVTTKDHELAQKMRNLSVHGMPRRYLHTSLGYNSRLDAIQASVLNVKLPNLPIWVEKRKAIANRYQESLKGLPGIELPSSESSKEVGHGWNQYVIRVKNGSFSNSKRSKKVESFTENQDIKALPDSGCRDCLKAHLEEMDVHTIIYYPIPIHLQPAYKNSLKQEQHLNVTESLCSEVLSLPIFPELTISQQDQVTNSLKKIIVKNGANY